MLDANSIEFLPEEHIYLVDGVIVPSVTQIVRSEMEGMYDNVPSYILQRKADYGNMVHQLIEEYEVKGLPSDNPLLGKYLDAKKDWYTSKFWADNAVYTTENGALKGYKFVKSEEMVATDRFAGTYDLMGADGTLFDIKTTYKFDHRYLEIQLGMYYYALGTERDIAWCIWMPKQKAYGQFLRIRPIGFREVEDIVDRYYDGHL